MRERRLIIPSAGDASCSILDRGFMSPAGPLLTSADVFYVVQTTTAAPGRRDHCLASILYEARGHADAELARLSAPATIPSGKARPTSSPPTGGML